jgi:predicted DNA-binding protein (MmcQ/YjbR family)
MAHPQMFDDDDPVLAQVRRLSLALPGAAEKVSHGRPAFFTKKVFAYYGGSLRTGAGQWIEHSPSLVFIPDPADRLALLDDARAYMPAYLGPSGWLGIDLDERTGWDEVAELLDASFRQTAPVTLVRQLDAAHG